MSFKFHELTTAMSAYIIKELTDTWVPPLNSVSQNTELMDFMG
jgi:hypothetical protein